jgi:hypothetical protein
METQHQIKRTLSRQESLEAVCHLLDSRVHRTRSSLVEAVCAQFGFLNGRGGAQRGGCMKALRELERSGHFVLPAAVGKGNTIGRKPRRLAGPLDAPEGVPEKAGEVRGLRLIVVETDDQMRIWNEMMLGEHPQGAGPLVGAQMRYLIGSDHGWLGGFGFAASPAGHIRSRRGSES